MPPHRRSCLPCHILKRRCTREVPSCQSCVSRGKTLSCVYEETSLPDRDHWQSERPQGRDNPESHSIQPRDSPKHGTPTLQDHSQTMQSTIQTADNEQTLHINQASCEQDTRPIEKSSQACSSNGTLKVNNSLLTTVNDSSPSTTLSENVLCQSKPCWTKAYFEMPLPVELSLGKVRFESKANHLTGYSAFLVQNSSSIYGSRCSRKDAAHDSSTFARTELPLHFCHASRR